MSDDDNRMTAAGLDQIREILLGPFAEDTGKRQGALEKRLEQDVAALDDALRARVAELERELARRLDAHDQALAALGARLDRLGEASVTRRDLSAMFAELAARLGDDADAG